MSLMYVSSRSIAFKVSTAFSVLATFLIRISFSYSSMRRHFIGKSYDIISLLSYFGFSDISEKSDFMTIRFENDRSLG